MKKFLPYIIVIALTAISVFLLNSEEALLVQAAQLEALWADKFTAEETKLRLAVLRHHVAHLAGSSAPPS